VEKGTTFEIIEDGTGSEVELNDAIDDEGDESGTGTADDGMQVYESFIFGMLTNFDQLPLERIHAMLKMFVTDPPFEKSETDLERFLENLVEQEKLNCSSGMFSIKK